MYTISVKNRFQQLTDQGQDEYVRFVQANQSAMEECVPVKPKRLTIHTSTEPRVVEARAAAVKAHDTWIDTDTEENKVAWKRALYELHNSLKRKQQQ